MSDFVSMPLDKLLNRENYFSRVEKLERATQARPSATAQQLSEISQNTGDLVINGSLVLVDPDEGVPNITMDTDGGLVFRNQVGALIFESLTGANFDDVLIAINGGDFLTIENKVGGKGVIISVDDASHNQIDYSFNDDGLDISAGADYKINGVSLADSGTFTPNIPAATNTSSESIPGSWNYMRVLNIVTVSGPVTIDPIAAGATTVNFSLPIPSDFTTVFQASGNATQQNTNTVGSISSDATNDELVLTFQATDTASRTWRVMAMYQVL